MAIGRPDLRKRWWRFQIFSIVIATIGLAAMWDSARPLYAQARLVPMCVALTPLFMRPSFLQPQTNAGRWQMPKWIAIIAGMLLVQIFNVGLVLAGQMSWGDVAVILIGTAIVEVAAIAAHFVSVYRGRAHGDEANSSGAPR